MFFKKWKLLINILLVLPDFYSPKPEKKNFSNHTALVRQGFRLLKPASQHIGKKVRTF